MQLFLVLGLVFLVVAMTRPGPHRLLLKRGRRAPAASFAPLQPTRQAPDPTLGLRDPARPF